MKKVIFLCATLLFIISVAFAQTEANKLVIRGYIIDNTTLKSQKLENLPKFLKTYKKETALVPEHAKSGYSIFSDGNIFKFDQVSNDRIYGFLIKPSSNLEVVVIVAKKADNLLKGLTSIENKK